MPRHLHLDYETFCDDINGVDLRDVGAFRYANDPSTEILLAAFAIDDEEPVVWSQGLQLPCVIREALLDPDTLVWAHNAAFEMAISIAHFEKTFGLPCPDLSRFRCTANLARRAALPPKLETLAITLGLTQQKDKRGSQLIKLFSCMQPAARISKKNPAGKPPYRIYPKDRPEEFEEFRQYCAQDVRTEQEVYRKLKYFADPINDASYALDATINARGVAVNLGALKNAQRLIEEETELVVEQFRQITGLNPTQRDKVLEWFRAEGLNLPDLTSGTVEAVLEERKSDKSPAIRALRLKADSSYAAVKKVQTMIQCAGPHDNRIRGTLLHHGATTGRWSSQLVQMQNMKRPTIKHTEEAYKDICDGISRIELDCVWGAPLEVIASCIRHFVQDGDNMILDADYASIEARLINWLAGQADALEEYRKGLDRYKVMASVIYGIPVDQVNKHPQRWVGKTAILGLGYGMGAVKFRETCSKFGYELPAGLEFKAVQAFRQKHKRVVAYWKDLEDAAKKSIICPGHIFKVRNVAFLVKDVEGTPFLLLKLPSGRKLSYPRPEVREDRVHYFGNIAGVNWGSISTYGARLAENICQAVAADVMSHGAITAEAKGFRLMTMIHDQALAYKQPGQTIEDYISCLTSLPPWAEGLPLAAEGAEVPFYKKD